MLTRTRTGMLALPILLASTLPAQADAIDGNWCHPQAGNFEI